MSKYPLDAIYCHELIGLVHITEGALVMHIMSIAVLATSSFKQRIPLYPYNNLAIMIYSILQYDTVTLNMLT